MSVRGSADDTPAREIISAVGATGCTCIPRKPALMACHRAMTLSQAIALGTASPTDTAIHKTRELFRSDVNMVGNDCPVYLPGMEPGTSYRARSAACSVGFGKKVETCGVIGVPNAYEAVEAIQTACIERVRHETLLPEMMLVIGALQPAAFKNQNTVAKNECTRAFAVKRGEVEGVVPISRFPGWYQPKDGEVYNGGKRKVPALLFDHVRITLGANNTGLHPEAETDQDETHLVPIGASISAWKTATQEQQAEWHSGVYTERLRAKQKRMKRVTRSHLWQMRFRRSVQGQKNTEGEMRKGVIHTERHVDNPTPGMMTRFVRVPWP